MINRFFLLLLAVPFCNGCFNVFTEIESNLVGKISLINPHNQEDKGYKMVFYEKEFNSNILDEYVVDVLGNDTILIVKAINKDDCEERYLKIKHIKGNKPLNVERIDSKSYSIFIESVKIKYRFKDDDLKCP